VIDPVTRQPRVKRFRNKGRQDKHVWTVNGSVTLWRRFWHSPQQGTSVPVDVRVDAQEQNYTPGVREMACRLNNDGKDFDGTAENLHRTALIRMSGEKLRQIVLEEGRAVLDAQQQDQVPVAFHAEDCQVPGSDITRLYVGSDGVMVPTITDAEKQKRREKVVAKRQAKPDPADGGRKPRPLPPRRPGTDQAFKEFKAIVFHDESHEHWHEILRFTRRRNVGPHVRREAKRLHFAAASERIGNVDGALWIRDELQERPKDMPLDGLGLDFYHLGENVARCRRRVFGEKNPQGSAWADDVMHTFKHSGCDAVWSKLLDWRKDVRGRNAKQAADRLLNYISARKEMIRYPEFQAKGWQIGSGPLESRCKTSTRRLKGSGHRWDPRNAEAVAAHTTLKDSHQWSLYWATQGVETT
jgi:hypothetical protein